MTQERVRNGERGTVTAVTDFGVARHPIAGGPHGWRVEVTGELEISTVPRLEETLASVIEHGASAVLLDLSDVSFVDSTGLRTIVQASNDLEARGGSLTCVGLSAAAERILELTGVLERLRAGPPGDAV